LRNGLLRMTAQLQLELHRLIGGPTTQSNTSMLLETSATWRVHPNRARP
jgi:hypothetical protein